MGRPFRLRWSGPVSRILSWTTIYLGPASPLASRGLTRASVGPTLAAPIRPCSGWGLPSRHVAVTLVRSYHTVSAFLPLENGGVFFSVALSVGSRRPAVSWHPALWSPDFPHAFARGRPAHSVHHSSSRSCWAPERLSGRVLAPLCLKLRPCVLESERPVEHHSFRGRVGICAEVSEAFKLHRLAHRRVSD